MVPKTCLKACSSGGSDHELTRSCAAVSSFASMCMIRRQEDLLEYLVK